MHRPTEAGKSCPHRAVEGGSKFFTPIPNTPRKRPLTIEKEHPCLE